MEMEQRSRHESVWNALKYDIKQLYLALISIQIFLGDDVLSLGSKRLLYPQHLFQSSYIMLWIFFTLMLILLFYHIRLFELGFFLSSFFKKPWKTIGFVRAWPLWVVSFLLGQCSSYGLVYVAAKSTLDILDFKQLNRAICRYGDEMEHSIIKV